MGFFKDDFKEILSLIVVLGGGALLILGPEALQNALFTLIASTISYWVGSSSGSTNKDATISKILSPEPKPCAQNGTVQVTAPVVSPVEIGGASGRQG